MATFLLELLTEEIPANALHGARDQLARMVGDGLGEAGLEHDPDAVPVDQPPV